MPSKEEVLQWYESLKETLTQAGVDIHNPADLMRVQVGYLYDSDDNLGVHYNLNCEIRHAFKKRVPDATGQRSIYAVKRPEISKEAQTVTFVNAQAEKTEKIRARAQAYSDLKKARKEKKPVEEIKKLEETFESAQIALDEYNQDYRRLMDGVFAEHDRWHLTQTHLFDPETDYEHIEELYNKAKEGLLTVIGTEIDAGHRRQLYVNPDGTAGLSKDFFYSEKLEYANISPALRFPSAKANAIKQKYSEALEDAMMNKTPEEQTALLEQYANLAPTAKLPQGIARPAEVEKPGAWSWFKRIISAGFATGDFDRYDAYLEQKAAYERAVAETTQKNKELFKKYDLLMDYECRDDYPAGIEHPGKMAGMLAIMRNQENRMRDDTEYENMYLWEFETERHQHDVELRTEGRENPASFNMVTGERNEEESVAFWHRNGELSLEGKQAHQEEDAELLKGKMQDTVRKEQQREREERDELTRENRDDRAYYEQLSRNRSGYNEGHLWLDRPLSEFFEKIGALYGKDTVFGSQVFLGIALQNRVTDRNGELLATAKTDKQCVQDIRSIVNYAYHPERADQAKLETFAQLVDPQFTPQEIADSLASLVTTGADYVEDPEKLKTPLALTAVLLNKVIKTSQLDMTKPLRVINGEDVSLTNENDKEIAVKLANQCERLQRGNLLLKKHPTVMKKEKVEPDVPDLTAKRPYQPEI